MTHVFEEQQVRSVCPVRLETCEEGERPQTGNEARCYRTGPERHLTAFTCLRRHCKVLNMDE